MKFLALWLLSLVAVTLGQLFPPAFPVEDGVVVLDDANFNAALEKYDPMLVEFYAPWCGHCKSLAPEWAKAAKTLTAANSPITLAKLDATAAKDTASKYGIQGFPTIKFFRGGKDSEYNGGRTEDEIVKWVNKKSGPAYATLVTEDDLVKFQEKNEAFALGVYKSAESEHMKGMINLATMIDDELPVAVTTSEAIMKKLGVTKDTLVLLKTFDEKRQDMPADVEFDLAAVRQFLSANSYPLVQEFSQEAAKKIFKNSIQKHVLVFTDKDASNHKATIEAVRPAAEAHRGSVLVVNVPKTESRVMEFFGVTEDKLPTLYFADMSAPGGMKKFPYTGQFEAGAVKTFIGDVLTGKVKPTLKSEEPVPADTEGGVVVLKGKSFNDLVINNSKDVFVEFYAPWCGHCKSLAPTWDQLGDKYKKADNIVIAKMDATANEIDVPGVAVKGFPTIYFFKGDDKANPVKYEEGRDIKDFVNYLKKNAHNKVNHDEL